MVRDIAVAVAACEPVVVDGRFQRHSSPHWPALTGSNSGGRWGRPGTYPVLYLGRPEASVIVEAYRHLVDDVEGMRRDLVQPRRLVTCSVRCTNILDLRDRESQLRVGLTHDHMTSPVDEYEPCQRIAAVAHQLGLHGVISISASGLGETLALFEEKLPPSELPIQIGDDVTWDGLPADPRHPNLYVVRNDDRRRPESSPEGLG